MQFSSINIQGNIISSDILTKIAQDDIRYQKPSDFGLNNHTNVREEIGNAWMLAQAHWKVFKHKKEQLRDEDTGITLTRQSWILPLMQTLGYDLQKATAEIINEKSYAISHRATSKDGFPIHIVGVNQNLDKRPDHGARLSPHALVQEYLNNHDHLYALTSNGNFLRVLRDATRLSRLSYLEFNLERMMEEELYAEFAVLFRVLHTTRMPDKAEDGAECIFEFYHQEALASGTRIRERLSEAVEQSIKLLGKGLIEYPSNKQLREQVNQQVSADQYFLYLLRTVYRILFLLVIEERHLIYPDKRDEVLQKKRKFYYDFYSIQRLTRLVERRVYVDPRKTDLWDSLLTTFRLFEQEAYGSKLGIQALASGIFAPVALGLFDQCKLDNETLIKVLRYLVLFENENKQMTRVNYADLDVEEFGSVYEGLLEYKPVLKVEYDMGSFSFQKGDARSSSGSHYTPEELVKPLIKHSLDYIIEDKLASSKELMANSEWEKVKAKAPGIQQDLHNLILNLYLENEDLPGSKNLAGGNGGGDKGVSLNKLLSEKRIVWSHFSAPAGSHFGSRKHSRGMGKKQQQGVQLLSKDSQRKLERSRNASAAGNAGWHLPKLGNRTDLGNLQLTWEADTKLPTLAPTPKQVAAIWHILPDDIRHSLLAIHQLLSITVCDVACGSGHILLSAARRIGMELAILRESIAAKSRVEQPSPTFLRAAIRDVIRHCIYGVDLNPLAVELCKVALWLEAHNPGEPLNFLDHHIKEGNSIVGLAHFKELENGIATEAFKTLPGDEKELAATFRKQNTEERKMKGQLSTYNLDKADDTLKGIRKEFADFEAMPEETPKQISAKAEKYIALTSGKKWYRLKNLADLQVAQFFISKTTENKHALTTDAQYRTYLNAGSQIVDRGASMAMAGQKKFFHWFIEFPEVMQKGGFDCILGNPPFLGGAKISGTYGNDFLNYIMNSFLGLGGQADLVAYFFRRIYKIIRQQGFQSLLSTNTIAQGDSRKGSLDWIVKEGGTINHAVRSMRWPGLAAVEVSIVSIFHGRWSGDYVLNNETVSNISNYLEGNEENIKPVTLNANLNICFKGSSLIGNGFILSEKEATKLLNDKKNKEVVFPFLNGFELNNDFSQKASRWVIDFFKREENEARKFSDAFNILEQQVKPDRIRWKKDKEGNDIVGTYALAKTLRENWWRFERIRPKLYDGLRNHTNVLVHTIVTKTHGFSFSPTNQVFSSSILVFKKYDFESFTILQSSIHEAWAWKYSSTMKSDRSYNINEAFESFPFPKINKGIDQFGEKYYDSRNSFMKGNQLGLTKTNNVLHAEKLEPSVKSHQLAGKNNKEITKQYGKETWNLWNHLQKMGHPDNGGTSCSWEEAVEGIEELRRLHEEMDNAVLEAYGWHQDTEKWGKAIPLRHDFYEVDYLPENDRVRYTIHPEARKEVLKRLLLLNHERFEEEVHKGLHKKKDVLAYYEQKGKEVPADTVFSDGKKAKAKPKGKKATKQIKTVDAVPQSLFTTENETTMREFGVHEGIYSIKDAATIIGEKYDKVRRWFIKLSNADYEGIDGAAQKDVDQRRISFHGLVELVVIGTLLENDFKVRTIFKARTDLANRTDKMYPFATNNVRDNLKVAGSSILFELPSGTINLDGSGQYNLELIREFFRDIQFDTSGVAQSIMPSKGKGQIVIDPKVGGGKPSFKKHEGVQVETIMKFYDGEESIPELVEDYGITKVEVEAALTYMS